MFLSTKSGVSNRLSMPHGTPLSRDFLAVAVGGSAGGTLLFCAGTHDDAEDDAVASACPETEDVPKSLSAEADGFDGCLILDPGRMAGCGDGGGGTVPDAMGSPLPPGLNDTGCPLAMGRESGGSAFLSAPH